MVENVADGVRAFTSNVFLLDGDRPALVDVGNDFDVVAKVAEHVTDVDVVVLTHTHYDHVANLADVTETFDAPVVAFDDAVDGVDRTVDDEDEIVLGDDAYVALHTPGHKDDHLCLYAREPGILFAGDLVFASGSFGRTDLEEGDRPTLIRSIDRLIDVVSPDLAELHAGHGPSVTDRPYEHLELAAQAARF